MIWQEKILKDLKTSSKEKGNLLANNQKSRNDLNRS